MQIACGQCGAALKVNRNLAGTRVPCPGCGAPVEVPASEPPRRERAPGPPAPRPASPAARRRITIWLLAAQASLLAISLSCFAGALFRDGWGPPAASYFMEPPFWLGVAGIFFFVLSGFARRMPVLLTLLAVLGLFWACAIHYQSAREVDASRVLALSVAMLALFCALQHRRAVAG